MTYPRKILLIVFVLVLITGVYLVSLATKKTVVTPHPTPISSSTEQQRIDAWIASII